jgi:hypothetical protein
MSVEERLAQMRKKQRKATYPFAEMKVGDSFDIPHTAKMLKNASYRKSPWSIHARLYSPAKRAGIKITCRLLQDEAGNPFSRVWRTE